MAKRFGHSLSLKYKAHNKWDRIGDRSNEINKMGVRLQGGGGFHANFVDLNPSWAQERHKRAVERADEVVADVSRDMKAQFHKKHLLIFEKDVNAG